jgi:hypothetical protein
LSGRHPQRYWNAFPLGIFLLPLLGGETAPRRANMAAEVTFSLTADEFRFCWSLRRRRVGSSQQKYE